MDICLDDLLVKFVWLKIDRSPFRLYRKDAYRNLLKIDKSKIDQFDSELLKQVKKLKINEFDLEQVEQAKRDIKLYYFLLLSFIIMCIKLTLDELKRWNTTLNAGKIEKSKVVFKKQLRFTQPALTRKPGKRVNETFSKQADITQVKRAKITLDIVKYLIDALETQIQLTSDLNVQTIIENKPTFFTDEDDDRNNHGFTYEDIHEHIETIKDEDMYIFVQNIDKIEKHLEVTHAILDTIIQDYRTNSSSQDIDIGQSVITPKEKKMEFIETMKKELDDSQSEKKENGDLINKIERYLSLALIQREKLEELEDLRKARNSAEKKKVRGVAGKAARMVGRAAHVLGAGAAAAAPLVAALAEERGATGGGERKISRSQNNKKCKKDDTKKRKKQKKQKKQKKTKKNKKTKKTKKY